MNRHIIGILIVFLTILIGPMACREFYQPEVTETDFQYMVIEGFIETEGGKSVIKLSRTTPIYQPDPGDIDNGITAPGLPGPWWRGDSPITDAHITIEGSDSGVWPLSHNNNYAGEYSTEDYIPIDQSYRVRIITSRGEYLSDVIVPVENPDLALGYERRDGRVSIYASTTGNPDARYFMWEYEEDWEFTTPYFNFYTYNESINDVVGTPYPDIAHSCFLSNSSVGSILIGSSERLQDDRITRREIQRIDSLSEKLGERYSILVKQRAISADAFAFWEAIRKNSDDIGGIFSPLPSLIGSNFSNISDPTEPIVGHVSAGKTVQKRMFIDRRRDLGSWRVSIPEYRGCGLDTVTRMYYRDYFVSANYVPVIPLCEGVACYAYLSTPRFCADCRLRGNALPPEFWDEYDANNP